MANYNPATFKGMTFHDARPAFLDGGDTPRAYLERCLAVIEEREGIVRGWVTLNIDGARSAADSANARYKNGRPLSRIDGMPIGIKDLLMTRDMPTQMGSPLYKHFFPKQDSACVQALRAAGAVILGKTVTTELGMSHPGPTTNPFSPAHTPGGSSSGSAAVVGAGMVPAAIGTQVVGSVIRPAGFCANYALKPTFGALHRGERLSFSQSHIGVHAASLEDVWHVAIEMGTRSGGDPGYPGLYGGPELLQARKPTSLAIMRAQGWASLDQASLTAFTSFLEQLRAHGVTIIEPEEHPLVRAFEEAISECLEISRDVCAFELRWTLENLIEEHGSGLSSSMMSRLDRARSMRIDDYRLVLEKRETARRAHAAIAQVADAVVSPSSVGPAPRIDNGDMDSGISHTTGSPAFNAVTSVLGAPTYTLPLMAVDGLPVGVQFIGQQHTDHHLTGLCRWISETVNPVSM